MLVIRMARAGTKKRPFYHIVVADSRSPRDGRFIERLGYFNPLLPKDKTERLRFDLEKTKAWMAKGAQPSATRRSAQGAQSKGRGREGRGRGSRGWRRRWRSRGGHGGGSGRRHASELTHNDRRARLSRANRCAPWRAGRSPPALVYRRAGGDRILWCACNR